MSQTKNITKEIEMADLGLYAKKSGILAVSDLHIGYEEALNANGVMLPRFQFEEMQKRMKRILEKTKPETVVINGDLKHEFGRISEQEWREILKFLDQILEYTKKIVIIRGNHDIFLGPAARKRNIEIVEYFVQDKMLFIHGNRLPEEYAEWSRIKKEINTIIIGNEHPAVFIGTEIRKELYKCFLKGKLKGKYQNKELIVMPSFNTITIGADFIKYAKEEYSKEKPMSSLFLDIANFEVYVFDEKNNKSLFFGKLKNLTCNS